MNTVENPVYGLKTYSVGTINHYLTHDDTWIEVAMDILSESEGVDQYAFHLMTYFTREIAEQERNLWSDLLRDAVMSVDWNAVATYLWNHHYGTLSTPNVTNVSHTHER